MRETKIFNANRVSIGVGNSKYVKRNFRFRVSICPLPFQISERDFCTAGWLLPIWNSEYLKIFFDIGFIFAVLDGYSLRGLFQKRFQNCLRFCHFRRLLIRKIFWKRAYFRHSKWLLIEGIFQKIFQKVGFFAFLVAYSLMTFDLITTILWHVHIVFPNKWKAKYFPHFHYDNSMTPQ